MIASRVSDLRQVCPVVGRYEETGWSAQCPMANQWSRSRGLHEYGVFTDNKLYPISQPAIQCYSNGTFFDTPGQLRSQYFMQRPHQQVYAPQMAQAVYQRPMVPDLPCNQSAQPWDYNTMCFDVNGQPCQYTDVVDLEDFMNNEKRKEKSRVAARCRRTKEMQIFAELTAAIPAKKEELEQLDKASVMRLAISYLRTRDVVSLLPDVQEPSEQLPKSVPEDVASELSYMKALDGFVMALSQQGDITYCSENISEHLGVSQMEIMGQSIFEFSHPCDHDEIREALRSTTPTRRDLLLRLKCTLTSKGRNVHLKSASYKVIHVTGHMLTASNDESTVKKESNNNEGEKKSGDEASNSQSAKTSLIAVGRPIPHPSNIEVPLGSTTFLSKHNLDMKFTYADDTLQKSLGFEQEDLLGKSLFDYHHAGDSASLAQQFKSLFSKGQCETGQYRFLARTGGYVWVQTQATLITDKHQKPVSIVCVNHVISGIEYKDEVFAAHQLQHAVLKRTAESETPNGAVIGFIQPEEARPTPATELIFAPRTKDMNKGFLMFSQDEGVTMLKDEPEDLTHLAPTAGDACIPLENSPFDMFDDFILNDNYCSLLGDDLASGSPVDSLGADSLLLSSPEPLETDSSCEPSSLLTDFSLDAIEKAAQSEGEVEDVKSPFIPNGDEMPVIAPAVMWGALPDSVSMARPQPSEGQTSPAPALQRLLAGPPTGPPPQDLITNIYSYQGLMPNKWEAGSKRGLSQEEEPSPKRARRSPSPKSASAHSSSVLMNLLDIQQQNATNMQASQLKPQAVQKPVQPTLFTQNYINPLNNQSTITTSPLPLNINIPVYSPISASPNCSPAMSPIQRDRLISLYPRTQSPKFNSQLGRHSPLARKAVSPGGLLQNDPYLTNKMQPSPILSQQTSTDVDMLLSTDFWMDTDMFQDSRDLLTGLDDIKLV